MTGKSGVRNRIVVYANKVEIGRASDELMGTLFSLAIYVRYMDVYACKMHQDITHKICAFH